jgi:hypothetical protein
MVSGTWFVTLPSVAKSSLRDRAFTLADGSNSGRLSQAGPDEKQRGLSLTGEKRPFLFLRILSG